MMEQLSKFTEYVSYPCHMERLKWLYKTIEQKISITKCKILDVGCGTGNITIPLATLKNSEVLGIDVHQENLDITAQKNLFKNLELKFLYFNECDISSFDFIILTEVLEHIPHYKDAIFNHLKLQAKNDVSVLITIPNGFGPFEIAMQPLYLMRKIGLNNFILKVKKLLGKKEPYSQNYDTPHVNFFSIPRLKRELRDYGFVIESVTNAYFLAPVIETYLPFIPLATISKIDNKIASLLPAFMASGWYLKIKRQ